MGKTLQQAWVAFTTAFMALEILMKAVLHLCNWAEQTAGAFEDESRIDRLAKKKAAEAVNGVQLPVDAPVETV